MAGLVPAIHVFFKARREDVDARHKAGHDDSVLAAVPVNGHIRRFIYPPRHPEQNTNG
jgi:hypothetical protein